MNNKLRLAYYTSFRINAVFVHGFCPNSVASKICRLIMAIFSTHAKQHDRLAVVIFQFYTYCFTFSKNYQCLYWTPSLNIFKLDILRNLKNLSKSKLKNKWLDLAVTLKMTLTGFKNKREHFIMLFISPKMVKCFFIITNINCCCGVAAVSVTACLTSACLVGNTFFIKTRGVKNDIQQQ